MPQITTQEPSLQELMALYGNTPIVAGMAKSRQAQYDKSTDINQQQALQDLFANQQELPGKLRNQQLTGDTLQERLPGETAKSADAVLENKAKTMVGPQAHADAIKNKYAEEANKTMWEKRSDMAYQKLISDKPEDQKLGARMLENMPANYAEKIKHRHSLEVANANNAAQAKRDELYGRFRPSDTTKVTIAEQKAQLEPEYWFNKASMEPEGSPLREFYQLKGENIQFRKEKLRAAGVNAGLTNQIGLPGVAGLPSATQQPVAPNTPGNPPPGATSNTPVTTSITRSTGGKKAPVKISNDEDYNKLKSGDEFIDPKGNKRIKP